MQTVWRTLMISLDVRWRGASASRRLNCKNAAVEQARVGYMDRNRDWRIPAGAGAQSADCLGPHYRQPLTARKMASVDAKWTADRPGTRSVARLTFRQAPN